LPTALVTGSPERVSASTFEPDLGYADWRDEIMALTNSF
jgi:hypothetical protein